MLKDLKPDERIEKESNGFYGKMYYVISLLMILSVIVKVVCKVPWFVYGLELLALAVSGVFLLGVFLSYYCNDSGSYHHRGDFKERMDGMGRKEEGADGEKTSGFCNNARCRILRNYNGRRALVL